MEDMLGPCRVSTNLHLLGRLTGKGAELSSAPTDEEKTDIRKQYPATAFLFTLDEIVEKILGHTYIRGLEFQMTDGSAELFDLSGMPSFFEYRSGDSHLLVVHVIRGSEDEIKVEVFPIYFSSGKTWVYDGKMMWQESPGLKEIVDIMEEEGCRGQLIRSICRETNEHPYHINPAATLGFLKRSQVLAQLADAIGTIAANLIFIPNDTGQQDSGKISGYAALVPAGMHDTCSRVVYQGGRFRFYLDLSGLSRCWGINPRNKYIQVFQEPSIEKMAQDLRFLWSEANSEPGQFVFPLSAACYIKGRKHESSLGLRIEVKGKGRFLAASEKAVLGQLLDAVGLPVVCDE